MITKLIFRIGLGLLFIPAVYTSFFPGKIVVISCLCFDADEPALVANEDVRGTRLSVLAPDVVHGIGTHRLQYAMDLILDL